MMRRPRLDYYEMGPGVVAFSSTRHGGYSTDNYAAFNINSYCGDQGTAIQNNRKALCLTLGIDDERLVMPHQVHLTKVAQINEQFLALNPIERQENLEGVDALMTNLCNVCIGVSTADCIPILLYDKEEHTICAIHAGWRGTVKRIVEKAIGAMTKTYGTQPCHIMAQIGPGIHLDSFEVGDEVYNAFTHEGFNMSAISRHDEKWHIDLPACNRLQLIASGVKAHNIKISPICTFQHSDDYFSARRLGINSGRIFTGIMMVQS